MNSSTYSVKDITKTAMMAAITFIGIYTVKIPSLHGYSHMGDCMIFLSVLILGTRKGALAGGIGAALSDLLGGYMRTGLSRHLSLSTSWQRSWGCLLIKLCQTEKETG